MSSLKRFLRIKNINRKTLLKFCILAFLLLLIIFKILEFYFEIHYNTVPNYILIPFGLDKSAASGSSDDLLREDINIYKRLNLSLSNPTDKTYVIGFPRKICNCDLKWTNYSFQDFVKDYQTARKSSYPSTCSDETTLQEGRTSKVISYSLYIKESNSMDYFLNGIEPNLNYISSLFPGWLVRIYTNIPINQYSCNFICKYKFLNWCNIENIPNYGDLSEMNGRVWRYLVLGDPRVELFISRDLDSTASHRERMAILEWENSDKAIHVMRDSQWHDTEILAGLWGMKNTYLSPEAGEQLREDVIRFGKRKQTKFWDQDIAKKHIYNVHLDQVLAHDSYFCGKYPEAITLPFPTQRIGEEFVGHDDRKEMNRFMVGRLEPCPTRCRPKHGKNWKYC